VCSLAITPTSTFSSPLKPSNTSSTGKRRASSVFDDQLDAENIDPSIFNSPTKKCKTSGLSDVFKPSKFSLITSPSKQASPAPLASSPVPSVRKALSSPTTTNSTPISTSRGSPKIHKRISAISKRRASSSPFRRVDPPSFSQSSPALPFSIDAALSGTIPNYTPKSTTLTTPAATPTHVSTADDSMPKGWFFEIHEDTPEQEAANLMEHSASVLDISSDDDLETKQLNEERGKENIPPPDFLAAQQGARQQAADALLDSELATEQHVKLPRLRKITQDAMDEDRRPLGDLPTAEFYGEGCDSSSYVTVDAGLERPSGLSKEFEFDCPTPEKKKEEIVVAVEEVVVAAEVVEPAKAEDVIEVYADENVATLEVAAVAEPVAVP
jgi:hypothetical protein